MTESRHEGFVRYAWGVLGYMVVVILWGAFVRATGSGAGCGSHWPLCNGEVIPRAPQIETLIELSHRLTSAFAGFLVIGLMVWAWRAFPRGHNVRKAALGSLIFVITEGAIGAAIVLFEWVATDASIMRTVSISLHLNNTFILLGFLTLTAWWGSGQAGLHRGSLGRLGVLVLALLAATMLVSTAGAVTALGDTLFRVDTTADAFARAGDASAHHLERLRTYHPFAAVALAVGLLASVPYINARRPSAQVARLGRIVQVVVVGQILLGYLNVWLQAPVWMQLVHLLVADVLWIALILYGAAALSSPAVTAGTPEARMAQPQNT